MIDEQIDPDTQDDETPSENVNTSQLANAIVQAVTAANGPRKVSFDEYDRTINNHRNKPALTRTYFQNGIRLQRDQLTADAINMLNSLRPGSYADGLFQVVAVQDGIKHSALDIRYQNKTIDERMQMKSAYPTFEHMLAAMLREQTVAA